MIGSVSEKNKNPVVTLKAQARRFDYDALRAGATTEEGRRDINRGGVTFRDLPRMNFVINKKDIDQNFINQLYAKHAGLIENEENGKKNYRLFTKEVFKEMFKYAMAKVPSDPLLEELVTNCNQAGYEFIYAPFIGKLSSEHALHMDVNSSKVRRRILIDHKKNSDSMRIQCSTSAIPVKAPGEKNRAACSISFLVEFTLNPQGDKSTIYRNGKLSLTVPERLREYNTGDKNLFSVIHDYFYKLCEKLGFFTEKVEHGLSDSMEVYSYLEGIKQHIRANERSIYPEEKVNNPFQLV